jgi:hypothetical protein
MPNATASACKAHAILVTRLGAGSSAPYKKEIERLLLIHLKKLNEQKI